MSASPYQQPEMNQAATTTTPSDQENKAHIKRLIKRGQQWLCIGVGLMGLSFLLNFSLLDAGMAFTIPMYIATTLGTVCIFKGIADIMG